MCDASGLVCVGVQVDHVLALKILPFRESTAACLYSWADKQDVVILTTGRCARSKTQSRDHVLCSSAQVLRVHVRVCLICVGGQGLWRWRARPHFGGGTGRHNCTECRFQVPDMPSSVSRDGVATVSDPRKPKTVCRYRREPLQDPIGSLPPVWARWMRNLIRDLGMVQEEVWKVGGDGPDTETEHFKSKISRACTIL